MKQYEKTENTEKSLFLQKHSASVRIWHWLVFLTISFLIITVLFDAAMFNTWKNTSMVQRVLKENGVVITEDQSKAVAHEYGEKLWGLHKYLGFGLSFLLLSRMVIEITLSQEETLRAKIKNALFLYRQNTKDESTKDDNVIKHYLVVKYSYVLFYLLVFHMASTGLVLAFGSQLGLSRQNYNLVKGVHGFDQYLIYAYIVFHLVGVIIADVKHSKGIISGMVNGGE